MLFRDAAAEYMADKRKRLRASTLEGYRSALELHVLPRWLYDRLFEKAPRKPKAGAH